METIIVWAVAALLIVGGALNIYWQSKIIIKAKYKYTPVIISVFIASWLFDGTPVSIEYIILIAAFITVSIMNGTGGIAEKKVINNGFFSNAFDYNKITYITLIPIELGNKSRVVVIFNINNKQNAQMIFDANVDVIEKELQKRVPSSTKIEIGKLQ